MQRHLTIILSIFSLILATVCVLLCVDLNRLNNNQNTMLSKIKQLENDKLKQELQNTQIKDSYEILKEENSRLKKEVGSKHPIEREFEEAFSSWSGNTMEGVNILCQYGDIWADEMNKYYQQLFDELDPDKKQWIVSSQNQWERFTKENEELAWQTYDQVHHNGTIMQIHTAYIYYTKYKVRALELKVLFDYLNSFS